MLGKARLLVRFSRDGAADGAHGDADEAGCPPARGVTTPPKSRDGCVMQVAGSSIHSVAAVHLPFRSRLHPLELGDARDA